MRWRGVAGLMVGILAGLLVGAPTAIPQVPSARAGGPIRLGTPPALSVPPIINYQGYLITDGNVPGNGAFPMTFRIYADSTGGTALWTESHASVSALNGTFSVLLGSVNPLTGTVFDGTARWVETEVNSVVLQPRWLLVSVPYSFHAHSADVCPIQEQQPYRMSYVDNNRVNIGPKFGTIMRLTFNDDVQRSHSGVLTFGFANGVADLGLDTGTEAPNAWYYLYAVPTGVDDFTLRASAAAPSVGPTGQATWKYLGAFRNNSSSNILQFFQVGDRFATGLQVEETADGPGVVTVGPQQRSLSAFVPETASSVLLTATNWGLDSRWEGYVDVGGSAAASIALTHSGSGSVQTFDTVQGVEIPTPETPKVYQRKWVAAGWRTVWVQGWRDGFVDLRAL